MASHSTAFTGLENEATEAQIGTGVVIEMNIFAIKSLLKAPGPVFTTISLFEAQNDSIKNPKCIGHG